MNTPFFPVGLPGPDSGSQAAVTSIPDDGELLDAYSRIVTHASGNWSCFAAFIFRTSP